MRKRKERIIGVGEPSGKTDRALRKAARSATRANRATEDAARASQAASERTRGRTEGTYGVERVSSAKLVVWAQLGEGNPTALLSTYLNERCSVAFNLHDIEKVDSYKFWAEVIWFDKIVGSWPLALTDVRVTEGGHTSGVLRWEAEDE